MQHGRLLQGMKLADPGQLDSGHFSAAQSVLKHPQLSRLCSLAQTLNGAPFPQEPSASPTGDMSTGDGSGGRSMQEGVGVGWEGVGMTLMPAGQSVPRHKSCPRLPCL